MALLMLAAAAAHTGAQSSRRATAIRAEMAGVLLQSGRYDNAAAEYRVLLGMEPNNRAYRLGLARALTWGKRPRDAERELIVLERQRPGDATVEALLLTARADIDAGSDEAGRWLRARPGSSAYRRILARSLAREGRTTQALAHYDTLLFARPNAEVLVERANVHLARGDDRRAEQDAMASVAEKPSVEGYVFVGDLHRWRGDLAGARPWYVRARVLDSDSPVSAAGFARLARDERPVVAFIPDVADPLGWESTTAASSDNLGALLAITELRRGMSLRRGFDGSVGARALRLAERTAGVTRAAHGFGADVALSREVERGSLYLRGRARGGFVQHPSGDLVPDMNLTLAAFVGAWGAGADLFAGPAYPSLFTLATLLPQGGDGMLREQTSTLSIGGPLAAVDVAGRYQSSSFSDDNQRTTLQAFARLPLRSRFSLLYAGSTTSFARSSALYWSPERYTAHSAGAELAVRRVRGLSFAARVLPGIASVRDTTVATSEPARSAAQIMAGLDLTWRARAWEIGGSVAYGRGRAGDYERGDLSIFARVAP